MANPSDIPIYSGAGRNLDKFVVFLHGKPYYFDSYQQAVQFVQQVAGQTAAGATPDVGFSAADTLFNGSPQEQATWSDTNTASKNNDLFTQFYGQNPVEKAFGVPAGTQFTKNGVPLSSTPPIPDPSQEPGLLAATQRKIDTIVADQGKNVDAYTGDMRGLLGKLSSTFDTVNANEGALLDEYRNSLSGISIPDSQAAQAYADPQAIAAQQQALGMLFGAAGGSLDVHTNPEDLARQKQAADKLWSLTDPEMTAQERYIMEVARTNEERDRRAAMDAALRNLAARGQLGSGHEIGAVLGAQQTTSQNRLLQDLGAQAQAVQRAQQSLGLYSNLATAMRNESDAVASGNSDRRLSGMSSAGNLSSNMRNSSFNEAFSRGQAADQTAQARASLDFAKANGIMDNGQQIYDAQGARGLAYTQTGANLLGSILGAQSGQSGLEIGATTDDYSRRVDALKYKNDLLAKALGFSEERRAEGNWSP